jgi:hypothetical protein
VGIKLQPGAHQADLYTLVLYNEVARGDQNRPLTIDGRIAFFRDPSHVDRALSLGDAAFRKYRPFTDDLATVYDVPAVLSLVESSNRDEGAIIADFVNELLDFVIATELSLPNRYRTALHALADATTFDKDFASLFSDAPARRAETRDAVLWCLGAVLSRAGILDK